MHISLNVIVKNEYEDVVRIIKDYAQYFDELCFAVDDDDVYKRLLTYPDKKCRFFKYEWVNDFSAKRNFLAAQTLSPYIFRIDCDDEIENPENIKIIFDKLVEKGLDLVFVPYIYSRDKDGNCNVEHWRETIYKKRPDLYWKKSIHENLFYPEESDVSGFQTDMVKIIHNVDEKHFSDSQERNFGFLMREFLQDKEKTDPRTIAYIGRAYMAQGKFQDAISFLELLIAKSGWDDDKYFAWVHLANCHKELGNYDLAIGACNEALEMNMKFPDAYITKGTVYLMKEDYDKALDWFMYGMVRKKPNTMFVIEPSLYTYKIRFYIALAYLGKGDYEQALKYFLEAKRLAPSEKEITSKEPVFREALENETYLKNLVWLIKYLQVKDKEKLGALVKSIPDSLSKDERIWDIKHAYDDRKLWGKDTVVFYCGSSWEDWTPASVIKGIGGSEEAVIYISRELVKLGWKVTVFNQCGDGAGIYDGVEYKNYYEFSPNDYYNIVISWRNNIFDQKTFTLRKAIVWLHDVPQLKDFKNYKHSLDKVVVLSQFHRSFLPKDFLKRLLYISSNGINAEDFKPSLLPRNPHRIIYTSSYDRGIEHLLKMWKDVRKEVPDAELHLFYGWNTYDKMMAVGRRPKEYRAYMTKLMSQDGVFEHGRVGHKQLIKEFQKSGVWAYPCDFEEISCISAMKAQACGCVPVCTDYAALDETVKGGVKIHGKMGEGTTEVEFKEALIKVLKDKEYQEKLRTELPDKEVFSWEAVAKKWSDELFAFKNLEFEDMDDYEQHYSYFDKSQDIPLEKNLTYPRFDWAERFVKDHPELKRGLDVGSFDGGLATRLSAKNKGRFICDAQDIRPREFDYAKMVDQKLGLGMNFYTGKSIERIELDRKWDVIFCMEMLEHTIEPKDVIKKLASVLEDKGYVVMTVPDKDGGFGREKDFQFNSSHLRDFTIETLTETVSEWFDVVEMTKNDDQLIHAILRKK